MKNVPAPASKPASKVGPGVLAKRINELRTIASANYELDGGTMKETFSDQDYADAVQNCNATQAWKAHMATYAAARESVDMEAAEEYPARATKKEVAAAKKRAESSLRVLKDVAEQMASVPRETKTAKTTEADLANLLVELKNRPDMVAKLNKQAPAIPGTPYQGPMLALRDRLKAGVYKKAANGQPSCGDEIAMILGQLEPSEVIKACCIALDIKNPYEHLNVGQQSMNLRNKLRGALKKDVFGMGVVREAVEDVINERPAKPIQA